MKKHNKNAPHQAVLTVEFKLEMCERLPTGEMLGLPVYKDRDSQVFTVTGSDYDDCLEVAKKLLEEKRNGKL